MLAADAIADDLAALSDEFSDEASLAAWQRVNEVENWNANQLQTWDINQTQPGRMVMAPHTVVWYQNWRGPMAFKEVTGDFVITSEVHITDRDDLGDNDADDVPDDAQFSLGGLMIRTPRDIQNPATDWTLGSGADDGTNNGENYVFLSMGYGAAGNDFTFEVKTTRNSNSQLELTPINSNTATIQTARIGDSIITLYQLPGQDWVVHRRFRRADMPETLQVGIVSYSDWGKASDFDPFYHNGHVLQSGIDDPTPYQPFNPDLVASFEYARFARPDVPSELNGVDLVRFATDAQLLSFLGGNANSIADSDPDPGTIAAVTPTIGDRTMLSSQDEMVIELAATRPDGTLLTYSVQVNGGELHELDQQLNLYSNGNDYTNWGGRQEKWMQGNAGWYFILPNGELRHWQGSFDNSSLVATLDLGVYDDPQQLYDGQPIATATIVGNMLIINPSAQFVGEFDVELTTRSPYASSTQRFTVSVLNNAPAIAFIADQTMAANQTSLNLALDVFDADGDELTLSVEVFDEAYDLDQSLGLTTNGTFYLNWGGHQEKWIRDAEGRWYFILGDGDLYRWQGSFESSDQIASLSAQYYLDPTRLTDALAPAATAHFVGHDLVIERDIQQLGSFRIRVTADDGVARATGIFTVAVET